MTKIQGSHPKFDLLAPGRCGCTLKLAIFKLLSMIAILSLSSEIALKWMLQGLTEG